MSNEAASRPDQNVFVRTINADYMTPNIGAIVNLATGPDLKSSDIPEVLGEITIVGDIRASDKVGIWEMGGLGRNSRGLAMLVADSEGSVVEKPITFTRNAKPNGRQALCAIWKGSLVSIGGVSEDRYVVLVYKVTDISPIVVDGKTNETNAWVKMILIGYYNETWRTSHCTLTEKYFNLCAATIDKLKTKDCKHTICANPWAICSYKSNIYRHLFGAIDREAAIASAEKTGNVLHCLNMTETYASDVIGKSYIPVCQMFKKIKNENGEVEKIQMYMIALNSPEFIQDEEGNRIVNPNHKIEVTRVYTTEIKPDHTFPFNHYTMAKCRNYDALVEYLNRRQRDTVEIWLRYRGC